MIPPSFIKLYSFAKCCIWTQEGQHDRECLKGREGEREVGGRKKGGGRGEKGEEGEKGERREGEKGRREKGREGERGERREGRKILPVRHPPNMLTSLWHCLNYDNVETTRKLWQYHFCNSWNWYKKKYLAWNKSSRRRKCHIHLNLFTTWFVIIRCWILHRSEMDPK